MKLKRYWLSWYQPTEDFRPLTFPPNEAIRGWWNSGSRDDAHTLCAVVDASNERAAKAAVRKDWPEAKTWRFIEEAPDWKATDRFPVKGGSWEEKRLRVLMGKKVTQ